MTNTAQNFSRILIILPRQLGDILLGSSLAFALRAEFPNAQISWAAHPMGRQLLEGHPALQDVFYHPVWRSPSLKTWLSSPLSTAKKLLLHLRSEIDFLAQLRRRNFDFVVDSICTPKTAIMSFVTGARVRHGLRTRWNRNWAYSWLCSSDNWQEQYAAQARLNLLAPIIGAEKVENPPPAWLNSWMPAPQITRERVAQILNQLALNDRAFAVFSPTSRRPLRKWPGESFVELGFRLIEQEKLTICWFWGPGEFEEVERLHLALQSRLKENNLDSQLSCLPPLLTLSEAAVFSGASAIWVGNTNGLSHVAVAGGARTVQLYGPTSPAPWTHPDGNKHKAVQRQAGCVRCESNQCRTGTHECMKQLSVDDVLNAVRDIRKASAH